ncbi:hypothetical protein [Candidatus Doolittlea endobia]
MTLCAHSKRLSRKTIYFSKSKAMHDEIGCYQQI